MQLSIQGLASDLVLGLRNNTCDANGQPPERHTAPPGNNPCRHCLSLIEPGDELLLLSLQPFSNINPFAEAGPIFLHSKHCDRYDDNALPEWFNYLEPALIRCYDNNQWIRYDLSGAISGKQLSDRCLAIFAQEPDINYIDIRTKFGCFLCRVCRKCD